MLRAEQLSKRYDDLLKNTPLELRDEWVRHPATVILLTYLEASYELTKDSWANGAFTLESMEATCQKNAEQIGKTGCILDIVDVIKHMGEPEKDD
jgi:hypothetical protein